MEAGVIVALMMFIALIGSICGIVAIINLSDIKIRLTVLEKRVDDMIHSPKPIGLKPDPVPIEPVRLNMALEPEELPASIVMEELPASITMDELPASITMEELPPSIQAMNIPSPPPPPKQLPPVESAYSPRNFSQAPSTKVLDTRLEDISIEKFIGGKLFVWVSMLMLIIGAGLFLKYAYDRHYFTVPPEMRLILGMLLGGSFIALGDRFHEKNMPVLFNSLAGGGFGIFYVCLYFGTQFYHFFDGTTAVVLSLVVTTSAILMSVRYDALSIAIFGVVGGFLSPIILSNGGNHPHGLFMYVLMLNCIAMGAAFYRQWRSLSLVCFAGTVFLYMTWVSSYYTPEYDWVAVGYGALFYLFFIALVCIQELYMHLRRAEDGDAPVEKKEDVSLGFILALLATAFFCAVVSFVWMEHHPVRSGLILYGVSGVTLSLCMAWKLIRQDDYFSGEGFFYVGLGLAYIAVLLVFQGYNYGMIAMYVGQGLLFSYVGCRMNGYPARLMGLAGPLLGMIIFLYQYPIHQGPFTVVLNKPFMTGMMVVAGLAGVAYLQHRVRSRTDQRDLVLKLIAIFAGFILGCILLSTECSDYWTHQSSSVYESKYRISSFIVLWSAILWGTTYILRRFQLIKWYGVSITVYGFAFMIFLAGIAEYSIPSPYLFANSAFLTRLVFFLAAGQAVRWMKGSMEKEIIQLIEVCNQGLMTILLALELYRWGQFNSIIAPRLCIALISAAWGIQAVILVSWGLMKRDPLRRIFGICLFAVTVAKVILYDTSELEQIYRVVSWMACGGLLLVAGYLYHRFAEMLEAPVEEASAKTDS